MSKKEKQKTNDDDDEDSKNNADDDLDAMLENMDIDKDFDVLGSPSSPLCGAMENVAQGFGDCAASGVDDTANSSTTEEKEEDLEYWQKRLDRDEVFSPRYKPSPSEAEEIQTLAIQCGVLTTLWWLPPMSSLWSNFSNTSQATATLTRLVVPSTTTTKEEKGNSTGRKQNTSNSIILKRGPVQVITNNGKNNNNSNNERELILLTHGFCLTKINPNALQFMSPPYDACSLFESVVWIRDIWHVKDLHQFAIGISTITPSSSQTTTTNNNKKEKKDSDDDTNDTDDEDEDEDKEEKKPSPAHFMTSTKSTTREIILATSTLEYKQAWLKAWERVLFQNASRNYPDQDWQPGWQHALVQTSVYTAAITGQAFFNEEHLKNVNTLDQYNQMAPLHYAAIHNQVHVIQLLVEEGADIELEDGNGRTPIYYAQRDNLQPAVHALRELGAKDSKAWKREQQGELVKQARIEEARKAQEKKKKKEEKKAAKQAAKQKNGNNNNKKSIFGLRSSRAEKEKEQEQQDQEETRHAVDETKVSSAQEATSLVGRARANIGEALSAIQDRGVKINELADRTDKLEENAMEYKSLAAQMKAKLQEEQNKPLFSNPFARR